MGVLETASRAPTLLAGLLLAALPGCSRVVEPVSTPRSAGPGAVAQESAIDPFVRAEVPRGLAYPLAIGNRWQYAFELRDWIVAEGASPELVREIRSRTARWQMCRETLLGTPYVVEQQVRDEGDYYGIGFQRYRQDASGLYGIELPEPPDCDEPASTFAWPGARSPERERSEGAQLAGPARDAIPRARDRLERRLEGLRSVLGLPPPAMTRTPRRGERAGPEEAVLLRYPLRAGAMWIVRESPRTVAVVEGLDVLDLPAGRMHGWRVRIDSEEMGARDRLHAWYGRSGNLAVRLHAELEIRDGEGHRIATLLREESQRLRVVSLAEAP